jgi:branched-chain amino acid transport system substrate-binding protein
MAVTACIVTRRTPMRRRLIGFAALVVSMCAAAVGESPAEAQGTVKIGLILPYSGQFADTATQMDHGIKLYLKKHGDTVAGKKIEIIRKDSGGPSPDVAKRLAQELVVRDGVDILAGFVLTPNALAASDVSDQAKKFMVMGSCRWGMRRSSGSAPTRPASPPGADGASRCPGS